MPSATVIDQSVALGALSETLRAAPALALDTEFMRERTYRAELCLVQVADTGGAWCIDPIALQGIGAFADVLTGTGTMKVLHAARQDLEVLAAVAGPMHNVFDTQVAAALAGYPAQVGYADLVQRLLGIELAKGQTRTDWSRRPLTDAQVEYALDDVRYLLPLRDLLCQQIEQLGRSAWLAEELQLLADPAQLLVDPQRAWLRLKGMQGLDAGRMQLLRTLAAWREQRAIDRNRPRGWILDDNLLKEIVFRVPRSMEQLAALTGISEGIVNHSGEELLALVAQAGIGDPPPPLPRREKPDPDFVALTRRLGDCAQTVAKEINIAPEVLATRRDIEALARGEAQCSLRSGWRKAVIGEKLAALL